MNTKKRASKARGPSRKTPHVQRSPYRRIVTALKHQADIFEAAGQGGSEYARGFAAAMRAAVEIVDLVFFSDHSGRRGRDGA